MTNMSQYGIVSRLCDYFLWGGCFNSMGGVSDYSLICHAPLLYVAAWRQGGVGGQKMAEIWGKLGFESLGGSRIILGKPQKS